MFCSRGEDLCLGLVLSEAVWNELLYEKLLSALVILCWWRGHSGAGSNLILCFLCQLVWWWQWLPMADLMEDHFWPWLGVSRAELWGARFSQLLFLIRNEIYLAEIPLERFRVTGKLRLDGTSGDHPVQLSLLKAGSARLKQREEYQQENSEKNRKHSFPSFFCQGNIGPMSVTENVHVCLNIKHH